MNNIWKIVAGALKRHGLRSAFTLLSVIASIILEVVPPLILARAVDELTGNRAVSLLLAAAYFLFVALSGLADAFREAMIVVSGEGIMHSLRTAMMEKLRRLPASYFTEHEAGKIASIQVGDVDAIGDMFSSGIVSMFTDLGTVVSILIVVFTKSRGLGILLLIALPLLSAFTFYVQKRMLAAHTENRKATEEAGGILPETLHIIRSLHVFHAESFAEKRYDRAVKKSFKAIEKTNFYDAVYSPVIMTASAAVIGIMMSLSGQSGAFRSFFGMSVGTAVALITYVNSIFTPLSSIGMEIQTIQSAAAGWRRVQEFLDEEERPLPKDEPVPDKSADDAVVIKNIRFSYDGVHPVLDHFSLTVKSGEFVTLTGRTGAGKTTLFKLLLGLYAPDQGSILVDGMAPADLPDSSRRSLITCVEQKLIPVPGTIRDQVTLGNPDFADADVRMALALTDILETVDALPEGIDTPYRDSLFSQGQKQLLMISRAVVSNPKILLLDEITAGLDSATEKMVTDALIRASEGRTVLSISHRLSQMMPGRTVPFRTVPDDTQAGAAQILT